jgi:hypothetical protein
MVDASKSRVILGVGGDLFTFVAEREELSLTGEDLAKLAAIAGDIVRFDRADRGHRGPGTTARACGPR